MKNENMNSFSVPDPWDVIDDMEIERKKNQTTNENEELGAHPKWTRIDFGAYRELCDSVFAELPVFAARTWLYGTVQFWLNNRTVPELPYDIDNLRRARWFLRYLRERVSDEEICLDDCAYKNLDRDQVDPCGRGTWDVWLLGNVQLALAQYWGVDCAGGYWHLDRALWYLDKLIAEADLWNK